MFILGYANTVVTSQHISKSYFIKEIENGRPGFILPEANIRESLVEFESTYVNVPSPEAWVHINFQILPNSLSRVCIRLYKHGRPFSIS